jgi:hypothetical protein
MHVEKIRITYVEIVFVKMDFVLDISREKAHNVLANNHMCKTLYKPPYFKPRNLPIGKFVE